MSRSVCIAVSVVLTAGLLAQGCSGDDVERAGMPDVISDDDVSDSASGQLRDAGTRGGESQIPGDLSEGAENDLDSATVDATTHTGSDTADAGDSAVDYERDGEDMRSDVGGAVDDARDATDLSDSSDASADSEEDWGTTDIDEADVEDVDGDGDDAPPALSVNELLLLELHNATRAGELSPAPSPRLPDMTWDHELAEVAQRYAEACIWEHNAERSEDYEMLGGSGYVGENLSAGWGGRFDTITAAQLEGLYVGWAEEDRFYTYGTNSCKRGEMCGHYTQIVWRGSTRVGCGWNVCESMDGINASYVRFLVCNYAPGGNIRGRRPY